MKNVLNTSVIVEPTSAIAGIQDSGNIEIKSGNARKANRNVSINTQTSLDSKKDFPFIFMFYNCSAKFYRPIFAF